MNKTPFVTKSMIEEITKTYPTPFHIYDEKGIRENAKAVKEAGLRLDVEAPTPEAPSMTAALELYLKKEMSNKKNGK